ncbi:hypothetical protein [Xanthomonas hortorum]|uniref:hypothetical protein n=1 Tax=Xanthomonas hortorum TaxID=56454 RepID=UPI0029361226|nr:hypothetical protein [Xanthomonas hortorum]MDV2452960.1 hypothetical protein [Xanthomonas hortorum NBC5720]
MNEIGNSHIAVGGEFTKIFDHETFLSMLNSTDEAGVALKFHLIMEEFLNIWCSKIAGVEDLFSDLEFVPFKTKLQIAKNLGMGSDLFRAFGKLNVTRNKYSHRLNFKASPGDLESLSTLIDNSVPEAQVLSCCEFVIESSGLDQDGVRVHQVHGWSSSSSKKLFIMCALLTIKATFWMQEEFNKRGIQYTLIAGLPQHEGQPQP